MKPFVRPLVLALAGAVCAWALVRWVYRPFHCIREIAAISNSTAAADRTGVGSRAAAMAQENLRRARLLEQTCRTYVNLYPAIAANEQILGRDDDAIATYRRAMAVARRPELHFAIGVIQLRLGRMDDAMNEFVTAARFNPRIIVRLESRDLEAQIRARLVVSFPGTATGTKAR